MYRCGGRPSVTAREGGIMRRYREDLGRCPNGDANGPRRDRGQCCQFVDRFGSVPRRSREYLRQRTGRRGCQAALSWTLHRTETLAALVAVVLLGLAAAFSPSYRPSTRSTFTPYAGHCFTLLRMTVDPRPQGLLAQLTDGLRLVSIL